MNSNLPLRPVQESYQVLGDLKNQKPEFSEKKDKIDQIFQDLSTEKSQKHLSETQKKPIDANKLHKFIFSSDQINEKSDHILSQVDHLLTEEILENLRQICAKKGQNLQTWLSEYESYFDPETLSSLDSYDFFTLASLLKNETLESNSNFLQTIEQSNCFSLYKQYASCSSIKEALDIFKDSCDYSALAYFISSEKISIQDFGDKLSNNELIHLAPHLRYGDFRNIEHNLLNNLLLNSSKLNHLLINDLRIKTLPNMSALQTLNCSLCAALTTLPAGMDTLQILNCSYCSALTSLPTDMHALEILYCYDCSALTALPSGMVALQTLHCFGCLTLTTLPDDLHALQILHCFGCPVLAMLPTGMTALKTLHCFGCSVLTVLPTDMHALQILHCYGCSDLTVLPKGMTALRILYCFACPTLIALPSDMSMLHTLNCSGCYALTELPANMDNLQILDCYNCTTLATLPLALPSMQRLNCIGCISLNGMMPSIPKSAEVITKNSRMEFSRCFRK